MEKKYYIIKGFTRLFYTRYVNYNSLESDRLVPYKKLLVALQQRPIIIEVINDVARVVNYSVKLTASGTKNFGFHTSNFILELLTPQEITVDLDI